MTLNNTTFCSNHSQVDHAERYDIAMSHLVLVGILIPVIGLFLNSAFLFVLYRTPDMRTITNIYLANLAVADGLLLIVLLIKHTGIYWKGGLSITITDYICIIWLLMYLFSLVSVFFISLVALERYLSVCRPVKHRQTSSKRRAIKLTVVSWMVSFAIVACHSGFFRIWPDNCSAGKGMKCRLDKWAARSICIISFCQFAFACIANCIMFMAIVRRLSRRRSNKGDRNHVAKMLSANAIIFFACLTPLHVLRFFYLIPDSHPPYMHVLTLIVSFALTFNSAINPVIYSALNPDYRMAFRNTFTCNQRQRSAAVKSAARRCSSINKEEFTLNERRPKTFGEPLIMQKPSK